jgi:hypothetical protein
MEKGEFEERDTGVGWTPRVQFHNSSLGKLL